MKIHYVDLIISFHFNFISRICKLLISCWISHYSISLIHLIKYVTTWLILNHGFLSGRTFGIVILITSFSIISQVFQRKKSVHDRKPVPLSFYKLLTYLLCLIMGSEQSSQQGKAVRAGLRRGKSVPEYRADADLPDDKEGNENPDTNSPEPSVCSDSELPYISYTVNRPIGGTYTLLYNFRLLFFSESKWILDSPKKKPPARRLSRGKSLASATSSRKAKKKPLVPLLATGHNIVVVKEASAQPTKASDLELIKLQVTFSTFLSTDKLSNWCAAFYREYLNFYQSWEPLLALQLHEIPKS